MSNEKQTYLGIVNPYLGSYRGTLQQHAMSIQELSNDDLLVGAYGLHNTSNSLYPINMMLNWLTPQGTFDTNFGTDSSGQLLLENETLSKSSCLDLS